MQSLNAIKSLFLLLEQAPESMAISCYDIIKSFVAMDTRLLIQEKDKSFDRITFIWEKKVHQSRAFNFVVLVR